MLRAIPHALWQLLNWLVLAAMTLLLYGLSYLPACRGSDRYRQLFHAWCRQFVRALGVRLRLHDHLTRPLPERYLLVANHPSAFEDIGIPALFEVDSLAKVEVRDWWWVGRISATAGTLFVQREDKASRLAAAQAIEQALRDGRKVALYPEGGVKGMRVAEFHQGVFDISLRTGTPIVPVFIHYHAERDFYWHQQHLLLKLWQIQTAADKRADYHLFDAFDPADFDDKASYCDAVRARYLDWQREYLEGNG